LARLREEFNNLFERFWSDLPGRWEGLFEPSWFWDLELEDEGDRYLVRLEAPGFEPDDFEVRLSGGVLTIKADRREERGGHYRYGSLRRVLSVPQGIQADKVEARYRNGILEVTLPKSEEVRGKRIPVRAG
jgi:HSP20 family protein